MHVPGAHHKAAGVQVRRSSKGGVSGTPTVLFFNNGAVVERVVGARGQHYYEEIIEEDLLENIQKEAV